MPISDPVSGFLEQAHRAGLLSLSDRPRHFVYARLYFRAWLQVVYIGRTSHLSSTWRDHQAGRYKATERLENGRAVPLVLSSWKTLNDCALAEKRTIRAVGQFADWDLANRRKARPSSPPAEPPQAPSRTGKGGRQPWPRGVAAAEVNSRWPGGSDLVLVDVLESLTSAGRPVTREDLMAATGHSSSHVANALKVLRLRRLVEAERGGPGPKRFRLTDD